MRKKTLGLLVTAMCLTLSACGAAECGPDCPCRTAETEDASLESTEDASLETTEDVSSESTEEAPLEETEDVNADSLLLESTCYGNPVICINEDMFGSLIKERVELTTENWAEYLAVTSWEEEDVVYDDFGEIKETSTSEMCGLVGYSEEGYYHAFDTAIIEFKNKETGILYTYDLAYGGNAIEDDDYNDILLEDIDFNDYECTRIKGSIYFVDIPEEAIAPFTDLRYSYLACYIGNADSCEDVQLNEHTKRLHAFGVNEWQEKYKIN